MDGEVSNLKSVLSGVPHNYYNESVHQKEQLATRINTTGPTEQNINLFTLNFVK